MKTQEILLITTIALMLQGCGSSEDDTEISAALFYQDIKPENRWEERGKIQKHLGDYLFSDYKFNSETVSEGTLSRPAKNLVKKIWSQLERVGFSGYDPMILESNSVKIKYEWHSPPPGSAASELFEHPSLFTALPFHTKFVVTLMYDWIGIRYLILHQKTDAMFHLNLRLALNGLKANGTILGKYNSDEGYVRESKEWYDKGNAIIVDALKADPFFKQFFEAPAAPTDSSGSTSALSALKGRSGVNATQFTVNGVAGSQIDFGLPVYVQLKGSVDQDKSTTGTTGLVAYKLGNSVLGVVQSYANSGAGFSADSRHLESSIVAAHSFEAFFVEGQFGSVSATDFNFKDWSGVRSQVRLGIDTPFGAPFIQLTHRNFGHTSDTAGYVGLEIANTEFKADTYSFSTSLLTKVGHHSVHGATGSVDWTAALNLNSGVAFTTNLTLGSALESKAAFNLSLDR
ncbi:hypothetical protein [Candidatus Bodocaedibacter vickermanii]|uniref:Uncharacterized protein n=1 Tax=Candidatus Bodocaedibacter vickermanii TaxID=2741701 RepID=A0A7L9RUE1_9PROT|nr:hypothetical protein CPBP_01023 [Candidatus Paracaedibacteraceae bacterium 'Lake Konstanz']